PVGVEFADVAGGQPPPVRERLLAGHVVLPVATEDLGPAGQDLAVAGDADLGARDGPADGPRPPGGGDVEGEDGARLGEPVALVDVHTDTGEEVREPLAEWPAAADGDAEPAAEGGPDPAVHEPFEHRPLEPEERGGAVAAAGLRPPDGDVAGPVEELAVPVGGGL